MNEHLSVPPELEHLIEKRSTADRRRKGRRTESRRDAALGTQGTPESAGDSDQAIPEERRVAEERRKANDRRRRRASAS